jgi:hypothetical protein
MDTSHYLAARRARNIADILTGNLCLESYPCQHTVTIVLTNGERDVRQMNGAQVWQQYADCLSPEQRVHFSLYEHYAM